MIKEVVGDILLSKAQAVAHGVAPNDDFKQGLALSLRDNWPSLYKDFRHYCHVSHPQPGALWSWKGPNSPIVINLFTQEEPQTHHAHPGKATLANVNHALKSLKNEIKAQGVKSIAITRLATGVGGLEWKDVKPMIEKTLADVDVEVFVYSQYQKGVAAKE